MKMSRLIRLSFYFVVGVCLGAFSVFSFAANCTDSIAGMSARACYDGAASGAGPCSLVTRFTNPNNVSFSWGTFENGNPSRCTVIGLLSGSTYFPATLNLPPCPAGSSRDADGLCSCPAGQFFNSSRNRCEPDCENQTNTRYDVATNSCIHDCTAGEVVSSGYYPTISKGEWNVNSIGVPAVYCHSGCTAVFGGTCPVSRTIVNGVTQPYCQGEYVQNGLTCEGFQSPPNGESSVPPPTCRAGYSLSGSVNGSPVCVNNTTGSTSGSGDSAGPGVGGGDGGTSGGSTGGGTSGSGGGTSGGGNPGSGTQSGTGGGELPGSSTSGGATGDSKDSDSDGTDDRSETGECGSTNWLECKWSGISGNGKFDIDSAKAANLAAREAFAQKWSEVAAGVKTAFGFVNTGGAALPCWSFTVVGQSVNWCFSDYSDLFNSIAGLVLVMGAVLAAYIVLS